MNTIRALTPREIELIQPEVRAYVASAEAANRLQRIVGLLSDEPGAQLDLQTMTLTRPETDEEASDAD